MKKLLLSAAFVVAAIAGADAQIVVLSQTGGVVPHATEGSLSCGNSSTSQISENSYFRAYTIPATIISIDGVKVGIRNVTGSIPLEVNLYRSTGAFPASYPAGLTLVASGSASITSADTQSMFDVNFSTPVSVSSGEILVVQVKNIAATAPNNTYGVGVAPSETQPAYILAPTCGLTAMETITKVAADNNLSNVNPRVIIDLIGNEDPASTNDFFNTNFAIYPNPTVDVLNIESKNGLVANEIKLTDLSGKVVKVQKGATAVNVSDLASGTYIIDVTTNEGRATSKFIKK